ncbi:MAG TPA: ABC transporter ATP-binding protein [Tepidisphaeraceae bacterium]|nr:ABC transporter ATP-binding protein [Tepidisphaeraceae bacterium]
MTNAIDLQNVAKIYRGRVHALQGISMQVRRGEVFGLLGPNGAGKSTLVKIMMTVVHPTRAEGTLLGQPVGSKGILARVGYLPENHRFPRYLTGRQTLEFFGAMAKVDRATARRRATELLDTVGMRDWAGHKVSTYSKGMMQRIGLAQALMNDPDLVLLDEPTDGVDPLGRRDIRDVLQRLRERGKTVFINSHLLSELEMICDRVAILVHGQVARQGTIDELTRHNQRYEIELALPDPAAARMVIRGVLERIGASLAEKAPAGSPVAALPAASPVAEMEFRGPTLGRLGYMHAMPSGAAQALADMPPTAPPWPVPAFAPPRFAVDAGQLAGGQWVEVEGPWIRAGTAEPEAIQPLLDALRGAGLVIRRVMPIRQSLEDLFMEAVIDPASGRAYAPGGTRR